MKTIELQIPDGKKAEWLNGVLTLVDEEVKDNRPVTERIKTFEDACRELGEGHPLLDEYNMLTKTPNIGNVLLPDLVTYLKLRIIAAALNEGWKPQFTEEEYRYFPWFCFYTEKEIDDMSDTDRKSLFRLPSTTDYGGVSCACVHFDSPYTYSPYGSRLAFKTRELAEYAGKQFIDIWMDYVFKTK